jgi:hypothetical protein
MINVARPQIMEKRREDRAHRCRRKNANKKVHPTGRLFGGAEEQEIQKAANDRLFRGSKL